MGSQVEHFPDIAAASRFASAFTAGLAREAVTERGAFYFAVSGGTTPRRYFEELAAMPGGEAPDWSRCHAFLADERFVPPGHPDSNFRLAAEALFSGLPIPKGNVHPVQTGGVSPEQAALAYEMEIGAVMGQTGGPPRFDLIHLGMGADGHVASLFPGDPALGENTRWVTSVAKSPTKPKLPRITLTLPVLRAARSLLILAGGEYKCALAERIASGREDLGIPAAMAVSNANAVWALFA